jgi:micrococcal nuclease
MSAARQHVFVVAVLALACLFGGCAGISHPVEAAPSLAGLPLRAQVAYAVDGDTLRVRLASGTLLYVRSVGIDTPEEVRPGTPVECGAPAAAASMRELAPEGRAVLLRADPVAGECDAYGRLLAHAFFGRRQVELAQVRRGWAYVYRFGGQRFAGLASFLAAQGSARAMGRGVWGRCGGDFHSAEAGVQR